MAIRRMTRKLLGYLKRDLENILCISVKHPGCLSNPLPGKKPERPAATLLLYQQQGESKTRTLRLEPRPK